MEMAGLYCLIITYNLYEAPAELSHGAAKCGQHGPTRVGPSQAIEKSTKGSRNWAIFRLIRPFLAPESPREGAVTPFCNNHWNGTRRSAARGDPRSLGVGAGWLAIRRRVRSPADRPHGAGQLGVKCGQRGACAQRQREVAGLMGGELELPAARRDH